MLQLIKAPLLAQETVLPQINLHADRITVAKRLWRGTADDGAEFGFDLSAPLQPDQIFFQSASACYVLRQKPEPLIEILLDLTPSAAAGIGWAIGNLHLELSAEASRLLAPDEPALRQLLARLNVSYHATHGIFRPGRFVRGQQATHELGLSHKH